MEYVKTENGNIKVDPTTGHPMVKDGEKEFGVDAIGANAKLKSIIEESNQRRKDLGSVKEQLAKYEGIADPQAAIDALQKVSSYDTDLTTQLDNMKTTINQTWETKEQAWNDERDKLSKNLFGATVLSKFATSEAVKKTVLPPDVASQVFGSNFKPDGTAVDSAGNVIYSQSKPGEPAPFEEALTVLIETHPSKESILKSDYKGGGGGHKVPTGGDTQQPRATAREKILAGLKARGN